MRKSFDKNKNSIGGIQNEFIQEKMQDNGLRANKIKK